MKLILGILVLSIAAAVGVGTVYATSDVYGLRPTHDIYGLGSSDIYGLESPNAVPEIIESPEIYYLNPGRNQYYSGTVPVPEVTAIDAESPVKTYCQRPHDLQYMGGGNYRYTMGSHEIDCYVTDGTHKVPFSYTLVITERESTGYAYLEQPSADVSIPYWVDRHAQNYCNDQLGTKQILLIYNYLDRHDILDLEWNELGAESVYSLDLKKITCDWTSGDITDEMYQTELRKLKDISCA